MQAAKAAPGGSTSSGHQLTVLRGAGVSLGGYVIAAVLRFVSSLIVTRTLGAELFGLFITANRCTSFGGEMSQVGQKDAILRFVGKHAARGDVARMRGVLHASTLIGVITSGVVGLITFLLAPAIAKRVFEQPELIPLIQVLAIGIPLGVGVSLVTSALRAVKRIEASMLTNVLWVPASRLLIFGVLLLLGLRVMGLAWATVAGMAVGVIVGLRAIRKSIPENARAIQPIYEFRELWKFSFPILFLSIVSFLNYNADVFLLAFFENPRSVGIYGLVYRLYEVIHLPVGAFISLFAPIVASLTAGDDVAPLQSLIKTTARWALIATLPLYLGAVLFTGPVLSIFGKDFVGGADALRVLGFIALLDCFANVAGWSVYMSGRSGVALANAVFLLFTSLSFYLVFVPRYGLLGVAIGRVSAFALYNVLVVLQGIRILKVQPFSRDALKPVAAGAAGFALTWLGLQAAGTEAAWPVLLLLGLLFLGAYVATLWIFGWNAEDREVFARVRRRLLPVSR